VAAAAQEAQPSVAPGVSVEQVRGTFAAAGFQVDQAVNWDWTSPPVSTFQIHDAAHGRVVMVLVYPNVTAASTGRHQAEAREQALDSEGMLSSGLGPHLVMGYGESIWRGNVALVETSQAELDRMSRWQADRDNGVYVDPVFFVAEPSTVHFAVDFDVQQALEAGVVNL
jgi:hypothetical protein